MQDSLEDYIRISKNTKREEPIEINKKTLVTAQVKAECEAKAMQIVHFAIDGKLRPDSLFQCLPHISKAHYEDIVEERSISKLCGYPLCSNKVPEMPKKQFLISTKSNRVYDITERKNFCSNYCYRASLHIKNQIDTSPLWLRKGDEVPAKYTLLSKSERCIPGKLIDQGVKKPDIDQTFTSISSFAEMSLDEAEENELKLQEEEEDRIQHKSYPKKPPKKYQKSMKTISENEELVEVEAKEEDIKEDQVPINIDANINQKNVKKDNSKSKLSKSEVEAQIRKCFKEWFSLESLILLHGEDAVKSKLDEAKLNEYFNSLRISELKLDQQKKYLDICRKLHLKELSEEKFHSNLLGNKALRPIPDYNELKRENRELDVKVKSFYSGVIQFQDNESVVKEKKEESEEGAPAVLPLVDLNSQKALRRKIFLNSLNKSVQNILQILRIEPYNIVSELQVLVKTFNLKADNIVFKPTVWNYIAIVLLKVLSLKDSSIQVIFNEERTKTQLKLSSKEEFLNEILDFVSDIDNFVKTYIVAE